jgi:hypothetical protein
VAARKKSGLQRHDRHDVGRRGKCETFAPTERLQLLVVAWRDAVAALAVAIRG